MEIDLGASVSFVATHARVIERRRLHLLVDGGSPAGVLAALDAYRNPDGGYGWGLEPDQRSSTSQPVAAMHRLASQQQPDGGWQVTFPASSPAAALEWRGYATLQAVATLWGGV